MKEFIPQTILPPIAVVIFLVIVIGAGTFANCAVFAALFKHRRKGIFSILIQLCAADILLCVSLAPETWSWNSQTWQFGTSGCTIYQGLRVFTSTAIIYLITSLALHTLATINLEQKALERRYKRTGRDDDEDAIRSSQHSLVAVSDTSTPPRTMNVDYRIAATRVPATLPTIFVWILSASLSIPEFVLSLTVHTDEVVVCALESTHRLNIYSMLTVFTLLLPFLILLSIAVSILLKHNLKKKLSVFENAESKATLKLSLWLMFSYGTFCAPRSLVDIYSVYSTSLGDSEVSLQVYNSQTSDKTAAIVNLVVSSVCILSVVVRPLIYTFTLPHLRKQLTMGIEDRNYV